jgi:iron complex outermembrane receptor protein
LSDFSLWAVTEMNRSGWVGCVLGLGLLLFSGGADGQPETEDLDGDFLEMDLEELAAMDIVVTSVSKREEKLSEAPSAISVITQEDIRRSGVTSIPEALRMVPGIHVAHINSNVWAISARGFQTEFANKLLVLIDGRSVYTPLFSGVYWEVQDLLLEDIERIEVIRGPGATLWGANAVNGVINIITKHAKDTQGGLISGQVGSEEDILGIRYGWRTPGGAYVRAYGKFKEIDEFEDAFGRGADDGWSMERGGFRMDWDMTDEESLTFQGDIYNGDLSEQGASALLNPPFVERSIVHPDVAGGNLLLRWNKKLSETSEMTLQSYYDRTERISGSFRENRDTFDIDFTHLFELAPAQDIVWGLGYRYTSDHVQNRGFSFLVTPDERKDDLYSAFVQDTITLVEDRLKLTIGSKFEYNDYTGVEIQPSARIAFTPDSRHTTWAAVSRAVRTPSRSEHDSTIRQIVFPNRMDPTGPPNLIATFGSDDFDSEELIAYELGHRIQVNDRLSVDLAGFINTYDHLQTLESGTPFLEPIPQPHLVLPQFFENEMRGNVYGVEVSADYQVSERWKLIAGYTFLQMQLHRESDSAGFFTAEADEGQTAHHQFHLRSYYDLPCNLEWDIGLYAVSNLPNLDVPGYARFDTRIGWRPSDRLEFSVGAQNIFDDRHPEFGMASATQAFEVEHSVYGKMTYRF